MKKRENRQLYENPPVTAGGTDTLARRQGILRVLSLCIGVSMVQCLCFLPIKLVPGQSVQAQVRPEYSRGAIGLGQHLRRLQTTASVLHTGAHPDDEDSALIARLARGDQARVAYFSLNRGEGGQNIIGPEQHEPLGVIRTEELLQARTLDGREQYFSRSFDYGFSKTQAEAAQKWNERALLADMVAVIRKFRPLIVVSAFSGTPEDGHGQHQFAGYLTPLAVQAAADPKQFPEQTASGLRPWRVRKLYVSTFHIRRTEDQTVVKIRTGEFDPLLGRTYLEIAAQGRSQHKSQDMGMLEYRGERFTGVRLLESTVNTGTPEQHIFEGIDVSIQGIESLSGIQAGWITNELRIIQDTAQQALKKYRPFSPRACLPELAAGLRAVRDAREKLKILGPTGQAAAAADADFILQLKEREFKETIQAAAGVVVDVLSDRETVVPGEQFHALVRVFSPDPADLSVDDIKLQVPKDWKIEQIPDAELPDSAKRVFSADQAVRAVAYRVTVPQTAEITEPYWLRRPRKGDQFEWPAGRVVGDPFEPALVSGRIVFKVEGEKIQAEQPIQFRFADPVRGELRRELEVVPSLSVALDEDLIVSPNSVRDRRHGLVVKLTAHSRNPISGTIRLNLPEGWSSAPNQIEFQLKSSGEKASFPMTIIVPGGTKLGDYKISATVECQGQTFDRGLHEAAYPHIQTHRWYSPAQAKVLVLDLKVAAVRVGYVMGSGDDIPQAIRRMGLSVDLLAETDLSVGDLSKYDVIIVGIRATQVRADLVANNNRVLDYVRKGGTLIVQSQRPDYLERNLAPFPAKMHSRVTEETAPVTVLKPDHPIFNFPNRVTPEDWRDWVSERTIYNFTTFDPQYVPLLESHDKGEPEQLGGLLVAEVGRGKYVYTGLAFFRQLPAGVPGAYRLFADLVSLPKSPRKVSTVRGSGRVP